MKTLPLYISLRSAPFPVSTSLRKLISKRLGLWSAVAGLLVGLAIAADITGSVLNKNTQRFLERAEVQVPGTSFLACTDKDGSYRLAGLPAGTYSVGPRNMATGRRTFAAHSRGTVILLSGKNGPKLRVTPRMRRLFSNLGATSPRLSPKPHVSFLRAWAFVRPLSFFAVKPRTIPHTH